MAVGPIPWDKIVAYASWRGLDQENTDVLFYVIKRMDETWLKWSSENSQSKQG